MRLITRVLASAALFVLCVSVPSAAFGQTLMWDANKETDIAGYRVHIGQVSKTYTTQVDVGKTTSYQPQNFDWTKRWYFAVQAYNTSGLVSPMSAEAEWIPASVTQITSLTASTGYPLLTGRNTTWTATATNNLGPVEYRFYMYRKTAWALVKDYSTSNTYSWTPTPQDIGQPYALQVWVRAVGSTAQHEAFYGTQSFAVTAAPFQISADVDFPTPPGNQVTWTAEVASAPTSPLEYRFLVWTENTGTWSVFREYGTSAQAQWTPASVGRYAVEAWMRPVGSTVQFQSKATSPIFDVARTPVSITGLYVDTSFPAPTGSPITWTGRVQGGQSGPIQYQFWLYSAAGGWKIAQPYGPSSTFTWTPTWADAGDMALQIWVRSNGSTAAYEAWRSTGWFTIQKAGLSLTTSTLFPAPPGSNVRWLAEPANPANLEYQFLLYSAATTQWTLQRPYTTEPMWTWTPTQTGTYGVQVQARQVGSSAPYELFRTSNMLEISQGPLQVKSLVSNVPLPASPGTTITWTAQAIGGTAGPLQYQFWRRDGNTWIMVQDYSPLNFYSWTPGAADVGQHYIQVWVRSAGSTAAYEGYKSSGVFSIQ
ncbi:MAG TPA: hypothetical protein VD833_03380 [Vicinamibacterales bacterium]|nr:hypothetical protein [Vicinamibacterales bacterium]